LKNLILYLFLIIIFIPACQNPANQDRRCEKSTEHLSENYSLLKPDTLHPEKKISLSYGDLSIVFADNSAYGPEHRAGYNGIAELRHKIQDSTIFVPFYAGFNLEHIFGGDSLIQLFEPRLHPMELFRISDQEVLLYQSPTPLSHVESQTYFKVVEPHYIDITFRFIIHRDHFFKHGYAGLFWASYIHGPADRNIYFIGKEKESGYSGWITAYSKEHGAKSTHTWEQDTTTLYFAPDFNATLASHFSDYSYRYPFYYGRFHNLVLAFMFDTPGKIRFSQSPTGGGEFNPAWDFQYIIPDIKVGREYSFRARMIYKKFKGKENIEEEYRKWKFSLNQI